MPNKPGKNKICIFFLFAFFLFLTGCRESAVSFTASPLPLPPVSTASTAPWQSLAPEMLPVTIVFPAQLSDLPEISLLGSIEEAEIALYGLGKEYGNGVLLCQGEHLVHFEQKFFPDSLSLAQLPTLWWQDFDGDNQSELAVKYHTGQDEAGGCTYDLIFYDCSDGLWTSAAAGRDFCAETILTEIDTVWDERSHLCTLSYAGQQVAVSFPPDTAPGRLVIGHLCLYMEENGQFTAILDAWFPALSASAATFRAQILYDGDSVALQNIRMDSFAGV